MVNRQANQVSRSILRLRNGDMAPVEDVVAAEREKLAEYTESQSRLATALERVRDAG